jgi:hypothetical protein
MEMPDNAAVQGVLFERLRNADLLLSELRASHEQTPKVQAAIQRLEEAQSEAVRATG